jgi:excisionase family DNA binding protein
VELHGATRRRWDVPDLTSTRYYTVAEVAAILRLKPKSVWELCRAHKIPATKPAGTWLIPVEDFDAWVKAGANRASA